MSRIARCLLVLAVVTAGLISLPAARAMEIRGSVERHLRPHAEVFGHAAGHARHAVRNSPLRTARPMIVRR